MVIRMDVCKCDINEELKWGKYTLVSFRKICHFDAYLC